MTESLYTMVSVLAQLDSCMCDLESTKNCALAHSAWGKGSFAGMLVEELKLQHHGMAKKARIPLYGYIVDTKSIGNQM